MMRKRVWSLWGLFVMITALLVNHELRSSSAQTGMAQGLAAFLHRQGHLMPRTWPMLTGITPHFLTHTTNGHDYWPCFSPDGMTVLFSHTSDGHNWELLRVSASGGTPEKFTQSPLSIAATRVNWSPKNNTIAFTGMSVPGDGAIWVIDGDGSGAHALTVPGLSNQMFYPSWYPDGRHLVAMDGRNLVIKRFDLAGGEAVTLTDHSKILTGMPSVSPDGKWIAIAGQKNVGQRYNQEENVIWLVSDGNVLSTLESNPSQGRAPVWSPDGERLAFESDRGSVDGRYAVFVIHRDGRGLIQVTDYDLNATHPVWSGDGRRMVFAAHDMKSNNTAGIAIIDFPSGT